MMILQGFLPVEVPILEVEVWGLGGSSSKQSQISYKKREELFTEQRRKVTSGNQFKDISDAIYFASMNWV